MSTSSDAIALVNTAVGAAIAIKVVDAAVKPLSKTKAMKGGAFHLNVPKKGIFH